MNIIADENIPFANEAFASLGQVKTLPGRSMKAVDLVDCDILLVRSITRVNRELLADSDIRFIASATIGTDHVDLNYLEQRGIGFANAPGCNAESAAEYVIKVLFHLAQKKDFDPFSLRAGVVGYGNVGSRVAKKLQALGVECLINDPPRQDAGADSINYVSLETVLHECNFITFHVPLTRDGVHPTFHLLNKENMTDLTPGCILFNAARGPVIDNPALSRLLQQRDDLSVFLDTWEGEPVVDPKLLRQVDFASPHIAGYSVEGKLRGTQMILEAACTYFQTEPRWNMLDHLPARQSITMQSDDNLDSWSGLFNTHYQVEQDHQRMLELAELPADIAGATFDALRKNYPARYEFNRFTVNRQKNENIEQVLRELLFAVD